MIHSVNVSSFILERVEKALQTLKVYAAFRTYARTIETITATYAGKLMVPVNADLLPDLGAFAQRFGEIDGTLWPEREAARRVIVEIGNEARPKQRLKSMQTTPASTSTALLTGTP